MVTRLSFDRGTIVVDGADAAKLAHVAWDERTHNHRASAHRYRSLRALVSRPFEDDLISRMRTRTSAWAVGPLRSYQRDALVAWRQGGGLGTIVLPTGAGKTRIALAAAASIARPTVVLCPTRVLVGQWVDALGAAHGGRIGVLGDGEHRIEDVTVMTFESAYRHMDALGDRFALVVVDEAHHFGSGMRAEALVACAAPYRLGLTATAPEAGSEAAHVLADLIGRVVFTMSLGDLAGTHLAPFEVIRLRVALTPAERAEYARLVQPFDQLRDTLRAAEPGLDWTASMRAMARTSEGRDALALWQRACALAGFPAEKRRLTASLLTRHREDKTLVFAALATHARAISCENLVPAITAEIARDERDAVLARFREGRVRCIVSARVLNEGVDVPDASIAILLGGSLGVREQVQRVGRVLRPAPGKRAVVYDVATTQTMDEARADRKWRRLATESLPTVPA